MTDIMSAHISATEFDHQIPSTSRNIGRISTDEVWNISVLKNEITAETIPLLSAVKKDDAKILNPANTKDTEKIAKAFFVISKSSAS